MKLYLIGLPGSGKSFFGKQLADELKLPFIDLDEIIERETGTSIAKIFSEKGEEYFRNLEATALRQQTKKPEFIMACGGGTACFHENMNFMNESGRTIFLNTPVKKIVDRFDTKEKQARPLLAGTTNEQLEGKLKALLEKRISFYNEATITISNTTSPAEILSLLKK